jgi:exodeoxyribonuclease VII small subunit
MAKATYKQLSDELQQLMEDLESGELDIDEAVKCYERGLLVVKELELYLKDAENKVTELKASTLEDIEEE